MRIITQLLPVFVFVAFSTQDDDCGSGHKYSSISCSRFFKCVDGQWREFACPLFQNFDLGIGKCSLGSKCRIKRHPGILDYAFLSSTKFGIQRGPSPVIVHSSVHHGYTNPIILNHSDNDENDRSESSTFKKFRYATKTINGEAKTTLWYYNSNGPNYKLTILGELPAPKEHMIEWLERNHQFYKVVNVPYMGDAPEDSKPMYYPPLAPQNPKPTIHAHEPKRPKPVNPISLQPPPKPKPKPVVVSSWVDVLPNECGFKGNVLPNTIKDKIVNGEAVGIEANPWQVAIMDKNTRTLRCGGSIISKNHVLTAAHCFVSQRRASGSNGKRNMMEHVMPKKERIIFAGNENVYEALQELEILELYIHSKYSTLHKRNDIALVLVDGVFVWSSKIYPICLPSKNANYDSRRSCRISGWGKRASEVSSTEDNLLAAEVKIVSTNDCKRENEQHLNITRGMFCAGDYEKGSVDSCQGDSGGPCTCEENDRGTLFGITSWGIGCGRAKYPGVYVKVALYVNWIKDRVELSIGGNSRDFGEDRDIGGPDDDENDDEDVDEDII